jgi:hypothetical protein
MKNMKFASSVMLLIEPLISRNEFVYITGKLLFSSNQELENLFMMTFSMMKIIRVICLAKEI